MQSGRGDPLVEVWSLRAFGGAAPRILANLCLRSLGFSPTDPSGWLAMTETWCPPHRQRPGCSVMKMFQTILVTAALLAGVTATGSAKTIWDQINESAPLSPVFE